MTSPEIRTNRLLLRAFTRADAADVFAYASNPNVSRHMPWQTHQTLADSEAFIEQVLARHEHEHTWALRVNGEGAVIGAIEFGLKSPTVAQLDYVLAESHWRQGLMTEAAGALIAWGLERYPQVRRVVSCTMESNHASQRTLEKCGFHFERTRRDHWPKFDGIVVQRQYAFLRDGGSEH